ncbi:MAG: glycosyltransferase family 2 protein [Phycisphaerae bacterium]
MLRSIGDRLEAMIMPRNHLLAIPVFNEEQYLHRVLGEARRYSKNILVVNDGSTDGSEAILRRHQNIHVITHPENRGYGQSLASAFECARQGRYDWLITMDCDEQHEPSCIPKFLAAASLDTADVISGTRYPHGCAIDETAPADRREINRRITLLLNRKLGLRITDAFCGFKAYRVSALQCFRITVPGYAMPMQLWVQLARAGLRVRELPVRLIYNDPTRYFGGLLDDPRARYRHYLEVLDAEWRREADGPLRQCSIPGCLPCP